MSEKFLTPRTTSEDTVTVSFSIPCCPDLKAILRGFLVSLLENDAWEVAPGDGITIEEAVAAATVMYETFEDN